MITAANIEWIHIKFGSLCSKLVNGGTPSTGNANYWNGQIPWVTGADFTQSGIGEIRRYVSDSGIRESSTSVVLPGNLLVVTRTGVGKLAITKQAIAISQDITGVYLDENIVETKFVYYLLSKELDELKKLNQGTSINGIIRSDLEKHLVSIPKAISVQRKIAHILQTIDQIIAKTEALIEKYQHIKAGLMHDLFTRGIGADGKLRPPREQAPELYQETPIGWIPKEWEPLKLKEILKGSGGYLQTGPFGSQLHAHEYTYEGVPVVMPQDINDGKIDEEQIARIDERRAQTLLKHRLKIGDIIIARRGELSRASAITGLKQGWVCGTGCFLLRLCGSNLDARFFSHMYRHALIQRQVAGLAVGSTMPSLNNEIMGKLIFPSMSKTEQSAIADKIELVDARVNTLGSELAKLLKQKSGLMHDLLTGKVSVPIAESEQEPV
jgi:type I restriction enzyme, S subunit